MERTFYVLVPVYNTQNYIDACIQSVLEQTYENFQLILVDDGTPDKAGEICDAYAALDPRVTVIHKENGGLISARRAAIGRMLREAQEDDFVVFLDSDDSLKHHTLQVLSDTIAQHNCDMVVYGMDRVFEGKVLEAFKPEKSFIGTIESKQQLYRTVFFSSSYNPLCRKAISVKLLSDDDYSSYYHIGQGEDLLQSVPVYGKCRKAVFIKDSLYNYTFNPASISNTYRYETYKIDSTVRQTVINFLKNEESWSDRDMERYLDYARGRVENLLMRIASFRTEKANKIELFQNVAADVCYRELIAGAKKTDRLLCLLRDGKYDRMLKMLRNRNAVRQLKKWIKGLLAR